MVSAGNRGEQIALQYLGRKGYTLLESNYAAPCGEIDLIVYNDRYIVFAEVKMRSSPQYGHPLETVTPSKRRKFRRTADHWLQKHPNTTLQPRIDVVGITAPAGGHGGVKIDHIENAF